MIQPNVYWTLEATFATIIGLYTNVPEGGMLDQDQIDWLQKEPISPFLVPRKNGVRRLTHLMSLLSH